MKIKSTFRNRYLLLWDVLLIIVVVLASYILRLELGPLFYFYFPSAPWMVAETNWMAGPPVSGLVGRN